MALTEQFIWAEKYRPKTVADCILPKHLKIMFQGFVDQGNIANMTLVGPSGTGKTTVARAMCDELDCDYDVINASLKGNIDTLRTEIQRFASSVSFKHKRKYMILDEADYLTHVTQPALRNFIEQYAENCGFILTANYENKIIEALRSRCPTIMFTIPKDEIVPLATQFMKRTCDILEKEGVRFDKRVVGQVIEKNFPDWRKVLVTLQHYAANGQIDVGVLSVDHAVQIKELFTFMKEKDFTKIRQWAATNVNTDYPALYREVYENIADNIRTTMLPTFMPEVVLALAKYMNWSSTAFDQEINFTAFCVEVMLLADGSWK